MKPNTGRRRAAVNTRASILRGAIEEFALRGLAGTRVEDIADRAGVNKSLIYQHFGSKQELYAEALNSVLVTITERTAANSRSMLADAVSDPFHLVRRFLDSQLTMLEAVPEYPRLLNWENLEGGRTLARLPLQQTYAAFLGRMEQVVEPLAARGVLPRWFDAGVAVQSVIALTHYFVIYRGAIQHLFQMDPNAQQTRDQWLDWCARMFVAGAHSSAGASRDRLSASS